MKSTKTLAELEAEWALQKSATYILGAGFSAAAGLPSADGLWKEVYRRALPMTGRAGRFRDDLDDYIKFKQRCEGRPFTRDDVDFEEFLGFLDVEHHLGLRGSDTWSEDGNESQVVVKTLIGQILTERIPKPNNIPDIYLQFAESLQPWDKVVTFNYDILLERACDVVGKPYRLAPMRYTEVGEFTASIDETCFDEFWRGMGSRGATSFRMVIIGYSLPPSDDYARQVIYRLVRNYQNVPVERIDSRRGPKEPLIFVDLCRNAVQKRRVKQRYRFIDWTKSRACFDGFNEEVIAALAP
jgi:hypothetical protein